MTQDEIIRMAREAGMVRMTSPSGMEIGEWWGVEMSDIERFAALVAAHVAERCAKSCEELINEETCYVWIPDAKGAVNKCVETIRSIGEKPVTVPANGLLAQEPSRDSPTDSQDGNIVSDHSGDITNLVKAAVLAEREACAKVCDEVEMRFGRDGDDLEQYGANQCAAAIRARGE